MTKLSLPNPLGFNLTLKPNLMHVKIGIWGIVESRGDVGR